jgi:hypothetical protein
VLLWDRRLNPETPAAEAAEVVDAAPEMVAVDATEPELERSLRSRLRARLPGTSLHN